MPQTETPLRPTSKLSQVTGWFMNLFTRANRWWMINIGTREVMPDINAESAISEGYNKNAAVYAIIETDAEKFASIPRYVVDAKSLEEKSRKLPMRYKAYAQGKKIENKLTNLLNRPNPYQGQAAFFKTVRSYYKATGEGFIWLNKGETEGMSETQLALAEVLEMYPLPSHRMRVVPDPNNMFGVIGYILQAGSVEIPFRKDEVIHWKSTNLNFDLSTREHLRGMPPLRPGASVLQQNSDATLSSIRMYQNDGAKGVLYNETMNKMSPQQESDIRAVVDRKINNNDIKGAVATLNGKWGYYDLGKTSVDLDLLDGKQVSWKELCFLFGVPYELFDSSTTFANKEQAQKNWVSNRIIPASKELDDELNRVLLRSFKLEGRAIIQCDYMALPEMQEDLAKLSEWLMKTWPIYPNEVREALGYEKSTDPLMDEPWVPQNLVPLSQHGDDGFDDMLNELGVQGANDYEEPKPAKKLNGEKV
jgi:HK97 family phage portal protein